MDKFSISLERDKLEKIKQIAKEQNRSVAFIIRELLNKGLMEEK